MPAILSPGGLPAGGPSRGRRADPAGPDLRGPSRPSNLTCPDCGGTLFEKPGERPLHFRCRTGHAYSPESLLTKQFHCMEGSLWAALRALEENASLSRRLEQRSRQRGNEFSTKRYEKRALEAEKHAEALRKILVEDREPEELAAGAEG